MNGNWQYLGDVCEKIVDCPHSTPKWTDHGFIVLRNQNIRNGRLDLSSPSYTDAKHYKHRINRAKPVAGDIIFTREAPMGEVCIIPDGLQCCVGQRQVLLRPAKTINSKYLLYAMQSSYVRNQVLWNEGTGSVVSNVRIPVLKKLKIPRFDAEHEQYLVNTLSSLDDKIDLNQRMNDTLESIVQALFKSWFVDFDPVKAKAEGRKPEGMDDATAALFPSSFSEAPIGLIPEGWEAIPFSEMIQLIGGGTPKTSVSEYWGGNIPWFSVVDAPAESDVFVINTEKNITQSGLDNSSARLLPTGTTIITARGTVGRIALVGVPMAMNQSCYGIRGIPGIGDFFIYYATKALIARLKAITHGSVFDTITRDTFTSVSFVRPPSKNIDIFESQVAPLFKRIQSNLYNISTLKAIRDNLFPPLISGKLRVEEVSETVEALAL